MHCGKNQAKLLGFKNNFFIVLSNLLALRNFGHGVNNPLHCSKNHAKLLGFKNEKNLFVPPP
jgi:hypothetical protein